MIFFKIDRCEKRVRFAGVAVLILISSTGLIGFGLVKRLVERPKYSVARQEEHKKNRVLLRDTYGAVPVALRTADGCVLSAVLVVRPQAHRVILMCHGFRMAKERMAPLIQFFPEDSILLFDHRAHGESEGTSVSFGYKEQDDVCAAIDFLQQDERTKHLPIVGLGVSMGAVALLGAAVKQPNALSAIVLDSPFERLNKQIERLTHHRYKFPRFIFPTIGRILVERELRSRNDLSDFSCALVDCCTWAQKITIPTLLIHSKTDLVSFVDDTHAIHAAIVGDKKELWLVDNCLHAQVFTTYPEQYAQTVQAFLRKFLENACFVAELTAPCPA